MKRNDAWWIRLSHGKSWQCFLASPAHICHESRASSLLVGSYRVSWFACMAYKLGTFLQSLFDGIPDAFRFLLSQEDGVCIVPRSHCELVLRVVRSTKMSLNSARNSVAVSTTYAIRTGMSQTATCYATGDDVCAHKDVFLCTHDVKLKFSVDSTFPAFSLIFSGSRVGS